MNDGNSYLVALDNLGIVWVYYPANKERPNRWRELEAIRISIEDDA